METDFRDKLESWMVSLESSTTLQLNSKESLMKALLQVTQQNVPYPKMTKPHLRFQQVNDGEFVYFGREKFADIVKYVNENRLKANGVRIVGNMGNGKSHLLAAYSLFLQCCRARNIPDTPRVVYIPNCTDSAPSIHEDLLTAFQESFPLAEFPALNVNAALNTPEALKTLIMIFARSQSRNSMIFIYDDWNYYIDDGDMITKDWLTSLAKNQFCIEALSAKSLIQSSARSRLPTFEVFGGLSDVEWNAWKVSARFGLFNNLSEEQEEFIKFQTGKVPVILSLLASYGVNNIERAWDLFTSDARSQFSGGNWIFDQLKQFKVPDNRTRIEQFINMMTYAMVHARASQHSELLYDHRFFNYDFQTGIVHPICGFVSCAMVTILEIEKRQLFWGQLNSQWVRTGLSSTNPSIRGFAFKLYAIVSIVERYGGLEKVSIERFANDFPLPTMLKPIKLGEIFIYLPNKWNLRYVDLVIKTVVDNKRSREGETVVVLTGVQITLQTPTNHKSSFDFYKMIHEGTEDFKRYILEGENIAHQFHWYVSKKGQNPAPQTKSTKDLEVTQSVRVVQI